MTEAIGRLLADRIGLDPESVGEGLIDRGVRARARALGLADVADYERAVLGSPAELQALIEEVVVPESWFFRDGRPFEMLRERAQSGWVADPSRPPLTVLSLPCAAGEEPYSIAMTLIDAGLGADRFRVEAVDVSERALARAAVGAFGPNAFRGLAGTSARDRHFREQAGRFDIDPAVRRTVRFRVGNLLDPGLLAGRPPFDVVFCRNLLIYFDAPARARAFETLGRLTADGGLLVLGHADRGDDSPGSPFTPLPDRGSFSYRKGPPSPAVKPFNAARPRPVVPSSTAQARPSPTTPETPTVAGPPAESPAAAMARASALADSGRYDEAARVAERAIDRGSRDAGSYFLLGMIRQAADDRQGAERDLLRAVYLDAQHDEALLALALLARRKGDVAAEASYRRRAGRVLARKGGGS